MVRIKELREGSSISEEEDESENPRSSPLDQPNQSAMGASSIATLHVDPITKDPNRVADDQLFLLKTDAPAPSTSSAECRHDTDRIPSQQTERRRIKQENRQRAQISGQHQQRYVFVPTDKVGRIVGKGGRRIKDIENKTGAKIQIENRKSTDPITHIILTGTDAQISAAGEVICSIARIYKAPKPVEPSTASTSKVDDVELQQLLLNIKDQVLDGEKQCREP